MTNIGIEYRKMGEFFTLTVVSEKEKEKFVLNVMQSDDENDLWDHFTDAYPNANSIVVDGKFEEVDCLTLREAAEISMIEEV